MFLECQQCNRQQEFSDKSAAQLDGWRQVHRLSPGGVHSETGETGRKIGSTHVGYCPTCVKEPTDA